MSKLPKLAWFNLNNDNSEIVAHVEIPAGYKVSATRIAKGNETLVFDSESGQVRLHDPLVDYDTDVLRVVLRRAEPFASPEE